MKLQVASTIGKNTQVEASDAIFAAPARPELIAQAIRVYLSNQRQGSSKTKTRSEINRTKQKWFKQKGTGNARHGARTPSIFVGGGVSHGPTGTQNYSRSMSVTMRRMALASALTAQTQNMVVSEDLLQLDGKTAPAAKLLTKMFPEAQHILVVLQTLDERVVRSLRNIESVYITTAAQLNTYQVAYADAIVMTKDAVKTLEARYAPAEKEIITVSTSSKGEEPVVEPKKAAAKKPVAKAAKPAAKKPAAKKATK